jgi:hypothetical protein
MALVACAPTFEDSIELGYVIVQRIAHAFGGIVVLIDGQSPQAATMFEGRRAPQQAAPGRCA